MQEVTNQVNTYLYSAQTLALQAKARIDVKSQSEEKASLVGACLSLNSAWSTWLEELASYIGVKPSDIEDEQSVSALNSPDCQVLFSLKRQPDSWYQHLRQLQDDPLLLLTQDSSSAKLVSDDALISIVALDENDNSASIDLIELIALLKAYILQTREQQTQW